MTDAPAVSVVVPLYNEEENIPILQSELTAALQGLDYEIVFVDDGSKDGTGAERNARYERIGKASAKAIKNMLAGTVLGDKLRAKGYTWLTEKKAPQEADRGRKSIRSAGLCRHSDDQCRDAYFHRCQSAVGRPFQWC
jgi:glycosyltransferase involved in cell wall biosynthesis